MYRQFELIQATVKGAPGEGNPLQIGAVINGIVLEDEMTTRAKKGQPIKVFGSSKPRTTDLLVQFAGSDDIAGLLVQTNDFFQTRVTTISSTGLFAIHPVIVELRSVAPPVKKCRTCMGTGFYVEPPTPPPARATARRPDVSNVVIDVDATPNAYVNPAYDTTPNPPGTGFVLARRVTNGKFPHIDEVCAHCCMDLIFQNPKNPNPNASIALGFQWDAPASGAMGYSAPPVKVTPYCNNIGVLEKFVEINKKVFMAMPRGKAPKINGWA